MDAICKVLSYAFTSSTVKVWCPGGDCHRSAQHTHSDHCHLSFNSNHLHLINTQLNQHYLSTHLTSVSCPISLTRSGLTPTLHCYLPRDYLPRDYLPRDYLPRDYLPRDYLPPVPRWSTVSPTSACLHPSPQLVFGVDPRCVLTTSSTSSWQENHQQYIL